MDKLKSFIDKKQYSQAYKLITGNPGLLDDKDLHKYIFTVYCHNRHFDKAKEFFFNILQKDVQSECEMMNLLVKIAADMEYENEILELYFSILAVSSKESGILEIGDAFINSKNYVKAAEFYKKILNIRPDNIIALKHAAQLSNFTGDFKTTQTILNASVLNKHKNNEFLYNILLNELEIAQGKVFIESKPRTLLVAVTTKCNIKCLMCTRDRIWDIPEHIKNEIISMFKYLEVVVWQGGEVFLYKYFFELLALSKCNAQLRHIIITNGLFFTDKWIDLLLSIKNLDLTVSVDGTTKEVYEKIRAGANFERLNDNLKRLADKKKQTGNNMLLTLRCAVMKSNHTQIVDFVKFAIKYDFKIVILAPVQNLHDEENIWNDLDEGINNYIAQQYEIASGLAKEHNIELVSWLPLKRKTTHIDTNNNHTVSVDDKINNGLLCFRPWKQITLNVDGFIMPECLCQKQISTVDKVTSFADVWNSDIMMEYRKHILNFDYSWCNKDCIAGAVSEEHLKFLSR